MLARPGRCVAARSLTIGFAALALLPAAGCKTEPPTAKNRPGWRAGAQAVWVERENDPQDFENGPGGSANLGYEFGDGALRPGLEAGVGVSVHEKAGAPSGSADLYVYHASLGGRLSWYSEALGWDFYGMGGWFWRAAQDNDIDGVDYNDNGAGPYAGLGANVWVDDHRSWGPFVMYSKSLHQYELGEWSAGLSFQIYY